MNFYSRLFFIFVSLFIISESSPAKTPDRQLAFGRAIYRFDADTRQVLNLSPAEKEKTDIYFLPVADVGGFRHSQFGLGCDMQFMHTGRNTKILNASLDIRNFKTGAVYGLKITAGIAFDRYRAIVFYPTLNYIHFTDFRKAYPCLEPEVSVCLDGFGVFWLSYGYNFFVNEKPGSKYFNDHVISFKINLGTLWALDAAYNKK